MENEPQDAYLPQSENEILEPFDVRQQSSRRGMMWLLGAFVFLVVMAFIVLKLFAAGTRDRDQTPRILADNSPYKEVPIDRGGEQTPNQDKEIYQKLNGTLKEDPVQLVPVAEQPLPKPKAPTDTSTANVVIKDRTAKPLASSVKTPRATTAIGAGAYVVQVASLRSRVEANTLWTRLDDKMGDVIGSAHSADIKRVDLGAKGIYYRLRVSGLADKNAATALCSRLKTRGQDCIVTKR
ncbi:MAG: hypothetical protein COA69_13790 [Robiginitomaculum sp.]|nr:MAG: hypothetical protein COA69_13790 [Robiginitomaculum sp.]